jgi:hypothetical protein
MVGVGGDLSLEGVEATLDQAGHAVGMTAGPATLDQGQPATQVGVGSLGVVPPDQVVQTAGDGGQAEDARSALAG